MAHCVTMCRHIVSSTCQHIHAHGFMEAANHVRTYKVGLTKNPIRNTGSQESVKIGKNKKAGSETQVLSGETRFLRIRAYPEKIGAEAPEQR